MQEYLLDFMLGEEIIDVLQVVVTFDIEELVLCDTIIWLTSAGAFQLSVDVHKKNVRHMASVDDVVIDGDYGDRTGMRLRSLQLLKEPVKIAAIHYVSEVIDVRQHPVGAFLADDSRALRLGINFHLDDAEVGLPDELWRYVLCLIPNAVAIRVDRRGDPTQEEPRT